MGNVLKGTQNITPTPKYIRVYNLYEASQKVREYSKDNNPINKAREEKGKGGWSYTPLLQVSQTGC